MSAEDLIALNEEIAAMARAGLPLDQGLSALANEMGRGTLRKTTAALADDLRQGRTLSEALERQSGHVPAYYAGLVAAGVRTNRIAEVLATLTVYARAIADLRTIVRDAMFYPAVILLFAALLFGFGCGYILPTFDQLFKEFNLKLPLITEITLTIGRHWLAGVLLPLAVLSLAFMLIRWRLKRSPDGRRIWAQGIYGLPIVGTLVRAARLAAFADLMALLIDHEVPLPEAFRLAGESSSEPLMAGAALQIHEGLNEGMQLSDVLRGRGLVPEWVCWMTGVGQKSGRLGATLHQIAEMYRRQVEMRAALLRSVLPPFMIICIAGVFVFLFVTALIMPQMKLMEGLMR